MKTKSRSKKQSRQRRRASLLGHCVIGTVLAAGVGVVHGAEDKAKDAPSPEEMFEGGSETYNNWVEFSASGLFTQGSTAEAQQQQHLSQGAFGGIQDLHYQVNIDKQTTFSLDGHALFDQHDYKVGLKVEREKLGYVRVNYQQFRTWYNGDGGYYRPGDIWYPLADDTLGIDRGEFSFEAGLRLEKAPQVTFKYTHRFRDGQKSSTGWGQSHPGLGGFTRGLSPSFYDIDETADIFELDVKHHIKKTDLGLGLRYETGDLNNSRNITQWPGEPVERKITDRNGTSYDMFSAHAYSETWMKNNLLLSTGFLFANMDSDYSGSRIYGSDFDVGYSPNSLNALGYYDLGGGSQMREYVGNINVMFMPRKDVTITPSLRVRREDWNSDSSLYGTSGTSTPLFSASNSDGDLLDVTERLDASYTGMTNWVLYARGEWTQGDGNLAENGGITQVGFTPVTRVSEDHRNFQKYSVGARWYPASRVTLDVGGYYKINSYDYDHDPAFDSTLNSSANRYPAYLVMQDFETYDGNLRLTLRPLKNVTLVTRYEYQISTVRTQPDPVSTLSETESSKMTSHVVGQNISWAPCSRLYVQTGINYVFSETKNPVSDYTQAILKAQNNYWTVNFNSGFVVDDKTDLNVGYFYYRADDYTDNSTIGVPLGSGAEEHGVTAMVSRRLSDHVRVNLKYGYFRYTDALAGGNNDYEAHLISSSLQYRF